jgi:uncharacterized oligopeptide transporter (OPT) family protein
VDEQDEKSTRSLFRIVGFSTAMGFGAMVGSLFAVEAVPAGLTLRLTTPAVIAFLIAAVVAWFYWRLVERMASGHAPEQRRRRFVLFSAGLGVVGVICFLYPLKFIPPEKRKDVFIGLALAITVLSGVGYVMWHVKKFLDADQKTTEEQDHQDK